MTKTHTQTFYTEKQKIVELKPLGLFWSILLLELQTDLLPLCVEFNPGQQNSEGV